MEKSEKFEFQSEKSIFIGKPRRIAASWTQSRSFYIYLYAYMLVPYTYTCTVIPTAFTSYAQYRV